MGKKDILLKEYFTPERFADAFNAIVFNGQKVVDPTMVLRVMEYDVREYLRQMKEGNAKLKPVITLVMYWKHNKWKYATTLREMFDEAVVGYLEEYGLTDYIPDYRMNIFTPEGATMDKLNCFATDLKDVIAYVKYSRDKESLKHYADENDAMLNKESITVINELTNSNIKIEEGKEAVRMCKALEELIADGRAEGIEAGRQEGSIIGFITACRKMNKTEKEIIHMIKEEFSLTEEEALKIISDN